MERIPKLLKAKDADGLIALLAADERQVRIKAAQALGELRRKRHCLLTIAVTGALRQKLRELRFLGAIDFADIDHADLLRRTEHDAVVGGQCNDSDKCGGKQIGEEKFHTSCPRCRSTSVIASSML